MPEESQQIDKRLDLDHQYQNGSETNWGATKLRWIWEMA
jgi:hypothetical protein